MNRKKPLTPGTAPRQVSLCLGKFALPGSADNCCGFDLLKPRIGTQAKDKFAFIYRAKYRA
jgi:hypothetical protein